MAVPTDYEKLAAKLSPEALLDGESLLRLTLDHFPDAIAIYDSQGRYQFINASMRQALGRTLEEVQSRTDDELFAAEKTAWYQPLLEQVLEQGAAVSTDQVINGPEGRQDKIVTMVPILDEQRQTQLVLAIIRDVTADRRSQRERDQLFEQSLSLLCVCGFDGYVKHWNPAWTGLLGYTADEMMSRPLRELVHPDDRGLLMGVAQRMRSGHGTRPIETRVHSKDGSIRWFLWNAVPNVEQEVYFATGQDITARKQVEEQLRQSQERFQLIASVTKEAIWDWDLKENRAWRNDGFVQAYGEPNEATETPVGWWRDRVHPEDLQRILGSLPAQAAVGRRQWMQEYRFRRLDGTYAHVFDRGFVIMGEDGQPVRMSGSIMDISDVKDTEEALRESEERFQLAAKATRDAIWDWDLRKGSVWRSEGFQTLFGYKPEEIGPDFAWWLEHIHEDDRDRIVSELPDPGAPGAQTSVFEYRFRRADGTYADVFDRGFVMLSPEGKPTRMIGTMMDMSERRRAEEAAQLQRAELAHMARVSTMGEIATGLAHELNQPLAAISNYAESCARAVAAHAPDGDEKILGWIEKITTNTHRAAEMIRRLRGFTRKTEPRRSTVEINELVAEVIDLLEAETRWQNVRVRWEPGREGHVAVDRIQIQQVLVNLLHNAYEAMADTPSEKRVVTLSAVPDAGKVKVSVEDAGAGIPPENRERVFEAFFTSKPKGVGIGLAISRSIIQDHGGKLWVTENAKRGVTFHFTLPLSGARDG